MCVKVLVWNVEVPVYNKWNKKKFSEHKNLLCENVVKKTVHSIAKHYYRSTVQGIDMSGYRHCHHSDMIKTQG